VYLHGRCACQKDLCVFVCVVYVRALQRPRKGETLDHDFPFAFVFFGEVVALAAESAGFFGIEEGVALTAAGSAEERWRVTEGDNAARAASGREQEEEEEEEDGEEDNDDGGK